jgi:hypothetical protein
MTSRIAVVLASLLLVPAAAGCSCGETHSPADAAPGSDAPGLDAPGADAPGLDAPGADAPGADAPGADAPGADAPLDRPDAAGVCVTHSLEVMTIQELRLLESLDVHAGRSFRVQASYTQSNGCHSRAMTRVEIDPATRTVDVTVRDWIGNGTACAEIARLDARTITLQLEAGDWTIRDASPGGTATLAITIGPGIRAPCVPDGGDCLQNCDCLGREVCLSTLGIGGPFTACAEPCEEDLDCSEPGGRCLSVDDGFDLTCQPTSSGCSATGCPVGYECGASGSCAPTFRLSSSTRVACTCDAECEPGLSCVTGPGGSRCEVACPTGGSWCSTMHFCAEARMDVAGIAASDAVCGWVGE